MDSERLYFHGLQSDIFKTLSDPNRLSIVYELRSGEKSVGENGISSFNNVGLSN
jgi:hypothetical protein